MKDKIRDAAEAIVWLLAVALVAIFYNEDGEKGQ